MLFTASTVKDTLPHVQRFVTGNLAGGVDHLVVLLDAPADAGPGEQGEGEEDRAVRTWLEQHPHVTCVRTDAAWWAGDRPAELNVRQRINANLVKAALTTLGPGGAGTGGSEDWVFHVDADEIVRVDRDVLAGVPADQRVVQLGVLEAVSRHHWDGDPTAWKRLLGKGDLTLLHVLGVIDRPHNGALFHGHVDGKSGIRPTLDLWLTLHHGVDAEGTQLERWSHDALRVLHLESWSGEEFVRKWTSILAAGPMANFRPAREPTAIALRALIRKGLSAEQAEPYLRRIYDATTLDDHDTLRDLGLLVELDPTGGDHVPEPFAPGVRERLEGVVAALHAVPKRAFHPGEPADDVRRLLAAASGPDADPGPAGRLRAARGFLRRS